MLFFKFLMCYNNLSYNHDSLGIVFLKNLRIWRLRDQRKTTSPKVELPEKPMAFSKVDNLVKSDQTMPNVVRDRWDMYGEREGHWPYLLGEPLILWTVGLFQGPSRPKVWVTYFGIVTHSQTVPETDGANYKKIGTDCHWDDILGIEGWIRFSISRILICWYWVLMWRFVCNEGLEISSL